MSLLEPDHDLKLKCYPLHTYNTNIKLHIVEKKTQKKYEKTLKITRITHTNSNFFPSYFKIAKEIRKKKY